MHRPVLSAVVSAFLLAAFVPGSASAADTADTAPVFVAGGSVTGRPEVAFVTVTSDSAITSVVADVTSRADGSRVEVRLGLDAASGQWRSPALDLPLGTYDAHVAATDADGDARTATYGLDLRLRPVVLEHTLTSEPRDLEHRLVTAQGRIGFRDPRTGTVTAPTAPGRAYLDIDGSGAGQMDLDPEGRYTISGAPAGWIGGPTIAVRTLVIFLPSATVSNVLLGSTDPSGLDRAVVERASIPATAHRSRIVLDDATLTVDQPHTAVVRGVVQRLVNGQWAAAPAVDLSLTFVTGPVLKARTGTTGRFAMQIPPESSTGTVAITGDAFAYLHTTASQTQAALKVTYRPRTRVTVGTFSVTSYRHVSVRARVTRDDFTWDDETTLYLQRSPNGRTGFTTVTSRGTDRSGRATLRANLPLVSGFYRVLYRSTPTMQGSRSRVFTLPRKEARIVDFSLSDRTPHRDQTVTVKGRVQFHDGTRYVAPGKRLPIVLWCRKVGSHALLFGQELGSTKADGTFSVKAYDWRTCYWYAEWSSTSSRYVDALSKEILVTVS